MKNFYFRFLKRTWYELRTFWSFDYTVNCDWRSESFGGWFLGIDTPFFRFVVKYRYTEFHEGEQNRYPSVTRAWLELYERHNEDGDLWPWKILLSPVKRYPPEYFDDMLAFRYGRPYPGGVWPRWKPL